MIVQQGLKRIAANVFGRPVVIYAGVQIVKTEPGCFKKLGIYFLTKCGHDAQVGFPVLVHQGIKFRGFYAPVVHLDPF